MGCVGLLAAGVLERASHLRQQSAAATCPAKDVTSAPAIPRELPGAVCESGEVYVMEGCRAVVLKASGLEERCAGCGRWHSV